MRAAALTLVLAAGLTPFCAIAALHPGPAYVEGEVLVKYRNAATPAVAAKNLGLQVLRSMPRLGVDLVRLPAITTVPQALAMLRADPGVEYAEPNFRRWRSAAIPNDPLFIDQWGLRNTGQANFVAAGPAGTPGADLNIVQAWDANGDGTADRIGDPSVIVAVIDDGVNTTHPDLAANITPGFDFADNDPDPNPSSSRDFHGTLVAGCVGAVGNNGIGVAGIAWNAKIMPLRFGFTTASEAAAIGFAVDNGAKIINASFGGPGFSTTEMNAIADAGNHGVLFVAAAGNHDANIDRSVIEYPSNYGLPNVVSVAATNRQDGITSFSEYGPVSVDVAAPGLQVVTTSADGGYVEASEGGVAGTSFAAPYVAGVAALIRSAIPSADVNEVKARLVESGTDLAGAGSRTRGGRVDADAALELTARPSLVIRSVTVDAGGNGVLDPGETAIVHVTVENLWLAATNVTISGAADKGLVVAGAPVPLGTLVQGATASADFSVTVPASLTGHNLVHFQFALSADGYSATRHYFDEVSELPPDTDVTTSFVGTDTALDDDFHAWHVNLPVTLDGQDLVIRTRADPDIDLLVKYNAPPHYDIALGADPESDDALFCTSGTTSDCQDPAVFISGESDGNETVRIIDAPAGTYDIVVVNYELKAGPLTYTISANREDRSSGGGGGGGGALDPWTLAALLGLGLLRRFVRRPAILRHR